MKFSLTYLRERLQVIHSLFSMEGPEYIARRDQIIPTEDLIDKNYQVIIIPYIEEAKSEFELQILKVKSFPSAILIYLDANSPLNHEDSFFQLEEKIAQQIFLEEKNKQVLRDNMALMHSLIPTSIDLFKLWPETPLNFSKKLWHILSKNLGAFSLRLIYQDLTQLPQKQEKSTSKKAYRRHIKIKVKGIYGTHKIEEESDETFLKKILDEYETPFISGLEIFSYHPEKNQLILGAGIGQQSFLIMAKIYHFTPLTQQILKSLFLGLDYLASHSTNEDQKQRKRKQKENSHPPLPSTRKEEAQPETP